MKKILLIGIAVMVISLGSCTTSKDKNPKPAGQLQQTTPNPERQAKIKELIRQLKEEPLWPATAAAKLIALDAKEAIPELMNLLDGDKCLVVMRTLGGLGAKEAIPKIMSLLNDKNSQVRFDAACVLGNLGAKDVAIPELIKLLNDKDAGFRQAAIRALGDLGAKEVIPELTKLLNDESSQVRLTAACALGNLGAKDVAIPELKKLLNDESSQMRLTAACALGNLGAKDVAIPELIKLLNDEDRQVRQSAGDALGELDDTEAIPELKKLPMIIDGDSIYDRTDSLWSHKQALVVNPKDASAYYSMGIIYDERLNNPSRAIACYQKYLELAPDAPDREKIKKWIEKCKERINHPWIIGGR